MLDISIIIKKAEENMILSIDFLNESLNRIRAGRANVHILDNVKVDYYGSMSALSNVATISTPDAKSIVIKPWEKNLIKIIEKAIMDSDVGITPENNGDIIRLGIPPLTEERRKSLVKQTKQEAEDAKISVRNTRRDGIDNIKKAVKDGLSEDLGKDAEAELQKVHDKYIKKIEEILAVKEKEILTV